MPREVTRARGWSLLGVRATITLVGLAATCEAWTRRLSRHSLKEFNGWMTEGQR